MPLSFAVVCEGPADATLACALADRLFCAEVDWIDEQVLDAYRQWRGFTTADPFLLWKDVGHIAQPYRLRIQGHFQGEPGAPDGAAARRVLALLKRSPDPPDGVLLIRDDDRQTERRRGLDQGRAAIDLGVPIVIGLAHLKRECWVLAGFHPGDDGERRILVELRLELGFDPCEQAERLTAKPDHETRSAKRVLRRLTRENPGREAQCWEQTALQTLAERGRNTGLADYLAEVRERLLPLFRPQTGVPPA
jgi:hypothetical protein